WRGAGPARPAGRRYAGSCSGVRQGSRRLLGVDAQNIAPCRGAQGSLTRSCVRLRPADARDGVARAGAREPLAKQVLWSESIRARVESGRPHFLARASVQALCAGKPSVLLDVASSDRPDLIVLSNDDPEMPVRDLCRWIRGDDR